MRFSGTATVPQVTSAMTSSVSSMGHSPATNVGSGQTIAASGAVVVVAGAGVVASGPSAAPSLSPPVVQLVAARPSTANVKIVRFARVPMRPEAIPGLAPAPSERGLSRSVG